jgi:ABC-type nitrate/sulfonate/bicarbonate transport system substrate-binding protein
MSQKKWVWGITAAAVLAAGTAGFWLTQKKEPVDPGDVVIKVADSTVPNGWELVQKLTGRDILKEEGVKLDQINSTSTASTFQTVLTGQLDVAGGAWVGWINVAARGGKLKAVYAASAITEAIKDRSGLLVLNDSPIKSIKDLKGKTIAVNVLGLAAENVIKILLAKNGLTPDDVELIAVPEANEEQVLRTHQADAVGGTTDGGVWFDEAVARGGVHKIPGSSEFEICGQIIPSASGFTDDFIQAHPDAVRRFVTAVEKTKRILWDEFKKDPDKVREAYADVSKAKGGNPEFGKFYLPTDPETSFIRDKDVQFWIDVLVSEGKLKPGEVKPSDVYTNEFNPFFNKSKNASKTSNTAKG